MKHVIVSNETRPLGLLGHVKLPKDIEVRLRLLDNYDMSPIVRRIRRKDILAKDLIDPAVAEFKRFMALFVIGHRGIDLNSREVDEVWHTFILFTLEYTAFCRKVAGRYIHHRPSESSIESHRPKQQFLPIYENYFGKPTQNEVQRRYSFTKATCHGSCHTDGVMNGCQGCDDCGVS